MTAEADLLAEKLRILLRAFTINESRFPAAEGKMRYSGLDFQTIHFVQENPDCNALSLAQFLGVSATTTQSVIDRLVRKGILERKKSEVDGRAVALRLTVEGNAVSDAIKRQDQANCSTMLASITPTEGNELMNALTKIVNKLDQ
jgi:DNA-binding MarR family transcriptional regulator